ncbi:MAG TPA: Crp/Fnr family transcriptional regulator [Terriglobales bacterium]|nr:Crp/Fnr family transcriptional regulator [Terriglobales bacterium]
MIDLGTAKAGERTSPEGKAIRNLILLATPKSEYAYLRPHLELVPLPHHSSLHEPRQAPDHVYFPNSGLVSLVVVTRDGRSVETGVIGREGIAGLSSAFGFSRTSQRAVVQVSGDAARIGVQWLLQALPLTPGLQMLLARFAVAQGVQAAQTAACNRLHDVQQRLARWLLMSQDRLNSGFLPITHDFLATMLGTDRPSVSLAARDLQKKQVIDYSRGDLRVIDRKGLEGLSCECYSVLQQLNGEVGLT